MARYYDYFRKPTASITSASVSTSSSQTTLKLTVRLSSWIPSALWEISQLNSVSLMKGSTVVYQGPVRLSKNLTWADTQAKIVVPLGSKLSSGTYKGKVSHTLYNLPGEVCPDSRSLSIVLTSPNLSVP